MSKIRFIKSGAGDITLSVSVLAAVDSLISLHFVSSPLMSQAKMKEVRKDARQEHRRGERREDRREDRREERREERKEG